LVIGNDPANKLKPGRPAACGILAALCLLPPFAWSQCPSQGNLERPGITPGVGNGVDFYANFVSGANAATYGYPLAPNNGANFQGDLNSTYFSIFYSIANAQPGCFELVVAGTFPNSRYFSITGYDMHLTTAQHLLDADLDPAVPPEQPVYAPEFVHRRRRRR
jgi:hypothetical protein